MWITRKDVALQSYVILHALKTCFFQIVPTLLNRQITIFMKSIHNCIHVCKRLSDTNWNGPNVCQIFVDSNRLRLANLPTHRPRPAPDFRGFSLVCSCWCVCVCLGCCGVRVCCGVRPPDRPPPDRPPISRFFFHLPPPFSLFCSLSCWSLR